MFSLSNFAAVGVINVQDTLCYVYGNGQIVQVSALVQQPQQQYQQQYLQQPQQPITSFQAQGYALPQSQSQSHKQFVAPQGFSTTQYSGGPAGKYIPGLHASTCPLSRVIPTNIRKHDVIQVRSAGPGWVEVKFKSIIGFMQV
jgi:hypothetical protein